MDRAKQEKKAEREKKAAEERDTLAAEGPAAFEKYKKEKRDLAKLTKQELRALSLKYYGVDPAKGQVAVGKVREKLEA